MWSIQNFLTLKKLFLWMATSVPFEKSEGGLVFGALIHLGTCPPHFTLHKSGTIGWCHHLFLWDCRWQSKLRGHGWSSEYWKYIRKLDYCLQTRGTFSYSTFFWGQEDNGNLLSVMVYGCHSNWNRMLPLENAEQQCFYHEEGLDK